MVQQKRNYGTWQQGIFQIFACRFHVGPTYSWIDSHDLHMVPEFLQFKGLFRPRNYDNYFLHKRLFSFLQNAQNGLV